MMSRLVKISTCSLFGLGGWVVGSWVERHKNSVFQNNFPHENFKHLPGLPVFGTVSAATPIVVEDAVSLYDQQKPGRISEIMKYGFPSLTNIRTFDNYVLSYDNRNRVAHWVFEHFNAERIKRNKDIDRSRCDFVEDKSIHAYFRSTNEDYRKSGFDRGHLAAAGNHRVSQKHVEQTFLLSNMAPQVGVGFNRDAWNNLEKHVRNLAKIYKDVYVCTGPLYLPYKESDGKTYVKYQMIGKNNVAVPTHFFKVVVMEANDNKLHMECYVMPNKKIDDNTPLFAFQVPIQAIERASGLLFFDKINVNNLVQINGKKN